MREKAIFKDFDLPTQHLGEAHYVPPKARSAEEIERRQHLPRGTLLAEQQQLGLQVASHVLRCVQSPEDAQFTSRLLAASGMNTAWYSFAQRADHEVQRRRLKLPLLMGRPEYRPDSAELLRNAADKFGEAADLAGKVVVAVEYRSPRAANFKAELGRTTGKAALTAACYDLGDFFHDNIYAGDADVQLAVRRRSSQALSDSRALAYELGTNPSIAQLANPDSDLSVYWRREAPNGAHDALVIAHESLVGA